MAIVIANMIGTGVFTSLGFQLQDIGSPQVIIILWILGGVLALSGAFSYAEIGTNIKKSGGEYVFLSEIFSPFLGYLAGWISLSVGFAAPVALSAIAVIEYFPFGEPDPVTSSILLVGIITFIHSLSLKYSSIFQNISTLLKVLLIVALIILGFSISPDIDNVFLNDQGIAEIASPAFAIALIYVSYSYSGWNAAVYITEEFKNPRKSLSYALIGGTLIVTIIYTLLQFIFLRHVELSDMMGQVDVGAIATQQMLGQQAGKFFSLAISLLLISGISAMVWVGPRVTASMANDYEIWRSFRTPENGIPGKALWLQFSITALLLLTGTFEQILIYCGFLLTASSMLTVMGVFILRRRNKDKYHKKEIFISPLFPMFQIIFILFSMAMIIFAFVDKPFEAAIGTLNLIIGALSWYIDKNAFAKRN